MKNIINFLILVLIASTYSCSPVNNYEKNKQTVEKENLRYQKDVEENPNSAEPHLRHANILSKYSFNEYKTAWKYYLKAITMDVKFIQAYIDFGDYIINRLDKLDDAMLVYAKALEYSSNNKIIKEKIRKLELLIVKREENNKLKDFGTTDKRKIAHNKAYKSLTNLDSLKMLTTDKTSAYYYPNLLNNYVSNKQLTSYQTYLLLIGYTQTQDYNPYNYNSINELIELSSNDKFDKAIEKGLSILKTNPLNPTVNMELMYCYRKKRDEKSAKKYKERVQQVFEAMLYTGENTCEKPYVTFWVKEEYNFAKYIGLYPTGKYSITRCGGGMADKLEVVNLQTKEKEVIYFNIMPIFKKIME